MQTRTVVPHQTPLARWKSRRWMYLCTAPSQIIWGGRQYQHLGVKQPFRCHRQRPRSSQPADIYMHTINVCTTQSQSSVAANILENLISSCTPYFHLMKFCILPAEDHLHLVVTRYPSNGRNPSPTVIKQISQKSYSLQQQKLINISELRD